MITKRVRNGSCLSCIEEILTRLNIPFISKTIYSVENALGTHELKAIKVKDIVVAEYYIEVLHEYLDDKLNSTLITQGEELRKFNVHTIYDRYGRLLKEISINLETVWG